MKSDVGYDRNSSESDGANMPDPATTIGLSVVGAYVAKDVVTRLLGPTADFLGTEMQEFAQRRKETVGRIFRNAAKKAQDRLDEPGAVPPRVLRDIVNQGSFQDDDLSVDYFGGVLASSRTAIDRDDRSATFTGLVSRLSTYQIRSHFISYCVLRSLFVGNPDNMYGQDRRRKELATFIPLQYMSPEWVSRKRKLYKYRVLQNTLFGI